MNLEECMIYRSWPSSLSGYPSVIDCKPGKNAKPIETLRDLTSFMSSLLNEVKPSHVSGPELIGGRYLGYKATLGNKINPVGEARSVYDKIKGRLIWSGGVIALTIPGISNYPPRQPELVKPSNLQPPPTPEGQKTIRKPVVYASEGKYPRASNTLVIGKYDEEKATPLYSVKVSELETNIVIKDFHCVTGWSVGGIKWRAISLDEIISEYKLSGKWIIAISSGGYSAIIPGDPDIIAETFIAVGLDDKPLPVEHGGPARLITSLLYGWKSVKWLAGIFVGDVYLDGFWEARGYHWRGLVALGERFKSYF